MKVNQKLYLSSFLLSVNLYAFDNCGKVLEFNLRDAVTPYVIDIPLSVYIFGSHSEAIWNLMCFSKLNLPKNHCIEIGVLPEYITPGNSKLNAVVFSVYTNNPEQYVDIQKGISLLYLCKKSTNEISMVKIPEKAGCRENINLTEIVGDLQTYSVNFNAQTPSLGLTK